MFRLLPTLLCLVVGAAASAQSVDETTVTMSFVDLTSRGALAQLQRTRPEHYQKITAMLEGLRKQPQRAESDWLQTTFGARDVVLSSLLYKTSYPPKQTLQLRLDEVYYTLHVVRSDVVGQATPTEKKNEAPKNRPPRDDGPRQ